MPLRENYAAEKCKQCNSFQTDSWCRRTSLIHRTPATWENLNNQPDGPEVITIPYFYCIVVNDIPPHVLLCYLRGCNKSMLFVFCFLNDYNRLVEIFLLLLRTLVGERQNNIVLLWLIKDRHVHFSFHFHLQYVSVCS